LSYDWIFLDADGTLVDYDAAQAAALEGAFEMCGLSYAPEIGPLYSEINIEIWRDFELGAISQEALKTARFDRLFEAAGLTADSAELSRRYLEILGAQTGLLDGAEDLVGALAGKVGMVLITNGLAEVQVPRFAESAIHDCFAEIVISGEIGLAKPDPAIFDFAFERIGRPAKERVLMVGDALGSDILGGATYGLDTCWYNPAGVTNGHGVEPTYEIRELGEILDIVSG
jgi:YjjG family noncanonical pyrimidine nucleotidase